MVPKLSIDQRDGHALAVHLLETHKQVAKRHQDRLVFHPLDPRAVQPPAWLPPNGSHFGSKDSRAMTSLELLMHPGCSCAPAVRESLLSFVRTAPGWWAYAVVNQRLLPQADQRRRYVAPTVLVDGRDLFGVPPARDIPQLT